jgi:hypothetical protein
MNSPSHSVPTIPIRGPYVIVGNPTWEDGHASHLASVAALSGPATAVHPTVSSFESIGVHARSRILSSDVRIGCRYRAPTTSRGSVGASVAARNGDLEACAGPGRLQGGDQRDRPGRRRPIGPVGQIGGGGLDSGGR